jgi:hypothetical protein
VLRPRLPIIALFTSIALGCAAAGPNPKGQAVPDIAGGGLDIDPLADPYRIMVPPGLPDRPRGLAVRVCVAPLGDVETVNILNREEPALNALVAAKVKSWHFKPAVMNGRAVKLCSLMHLVSQQGVLAPQSIQQSRALMMPPNLALSNMTIDPQGEPYRPMMPDGISGHLFAMVKVCVAEEGDVTNVEIVNKVPPAVQREVDTKIMRWRFRPFSVDGEPRPFCFLMRLDFER